MVPERPERAVKDEGLEVGLEIAPALIPFTFDGSRLEFRDCTEQEFWNKKAHDFF
jgi:hypothetical protein